MVGLIEDWGENAGGGAEPDDGLKIAALVMSWIVFICVSLVLFCEIRRRCDSGYRQWA